jgi:hypothetical protein
MIHSFVDVKDKLLALAQHVLWLSCGGITPAVLILHSWREMGARIA